MVIIYIVFLYNNNILLLYKIHYNDSTRFFVVVVQEGSNGNIQCVDPEILRVFCVPEELYITHLFVRMPLGTDFCFRH